MHLSVKQSQSIEEGGAPVNPEQTPADLLVLSFTDSDLACMQRAGAGGDFPSLRLTSLARLTHPLSVDLYIDQVARHAKVIVARIVGGHEWWRYGVEELGRVARENNIALVMVPGDHREDARLAALSTAPAEAVSAIDACLAQGGVDNARRVLACMAALARGETSALAMAAPVPPAGLYREVRALEKLGRATLVFYRAHLLAADTAPIDALLDALAARGISARAFMVASLKDPAALAALTQEVASHAPDVILDATAFSAGEGGHPLAFANVPVLQCALANASREAWENSARGLSTADLAMHVVLPEADGRIFTRAVSFKFAGAKDAATEFAAVTHCPQPDRVAYVASLAAAWARLSALKAKERKLALILSDYPGRAGRGAYAVGLDGPQSAVEILRLLKESGYRLEKLPEAGELLHAPHAESYGLARYMQRFAALPALRQREMLEAWGPPQEDAFFSGGAFRLPVLRSGNVVVALQPDRGSRTDRKSGYHDALMPPRHGYLAFYWWLRDVAGIDALIHLGTHGNLEWLPGKSAALSASCWPEIALGPVPVVYPYIVSDPGEAAQAKRRITAVTLSHMTPPLMPVALSPELAALEALVDEFSGADGLDARRMKLLRAEIIHRARRSGLPGLPTPERSPGFAQGGDDDNALMNALEAHLCDIKEQRVGDGLHVFGHDAPLEAKNLLAALDGKFIAPGPGGSPARGRMDVLPTGRNMISADPRMIPTPTAAAIGKRAAQEFVRRYAQDHGDWPGSVVIDVWGSATLRNGGDEIAQALYLMGVAPRWDSASHRVSGFDILEDGALEWPRIDVSLRISGLFRDMFANLITLFDDAARAVFGKGIAPRIFGSAPGAYGSGVNALLDSGRWRERSELGRAYMEASQFAYGRGMDGEASPEALKERIAAADALVHVQDQREMDVLSGADFADAEGGFAAASQSLGGGAALYHLDTSRPDRIKARTLAEEISLTLQARALNPAWIEGQMRHAYAGAAALADVVDQLFAFAATANVVPSAQFDAAFDAYLHDERVREFLQRENPAAMAAMAARFDEAVQRGLWNPLRNSARALLDDVRGRKEAA